MEESISGFKQRGTWPAVVEHGERITRALRKVGAEGNAYEDWNEWRPKNHEHLDEDVNRKTAVQASIGEGAGEKAGKEPNEDLRRAGEKLTESYGNLERPEEAVDKWGESIEYVKRAADSAGRRAVRAVEGVVYENVMTQFAPYYFDNELVSANLQRAGRGDDTAFVFEVNVNDDVLKSAVSGELAEYDDAVDRWHVSTERNVEAAQAAEGVELSEREATPDTDGKWTTN